MDNSVGDVATLMLVRMDHVYLDGTDHGAAAQWYARVLGLRAHAPTLVCKEDPLGLLILEACDGMPMLSLFARGCRPPSRDNTVAFWKDGAGFLALRDRLPELDPDGNRLEITTYDYGP